MSESFASAAAELSALAALRNQAPSAGIAPATHRFLVDQTAANLVRQQSDVLEELELDTLVSSYQLTSFRHSRERALSLKISSDDPIILEMWRFEAMLHDPAFRPVKALRLLPLHKDPSFGDIVRVQFAFSVGERTIDELVLQLEELRQADDAADPDDYLWIGRVMTEPHALAGLLAVGERICFIGNCIAEVAAPKRGFSPH